MRTALRVPGLTRKPPLSRGDKVGDKVGLLDLPAPACHVAVLSYEQGRRRAASPLGRRSWKGLDRTAQMAPLRIF
jgi:hypothetical protein